MLMKAEAQDVISLDFIPGAPESGQNHGDMFCERPQKSFKEFFLEMPREEMTLFSPGFYHLKSAVWLDKFETTIFELCLRESQFERV
jgi:hypothetical protein